MTRRRCVVSIAARTQDEACGNVAQERWRSLDPVAVFGRWRSLDPMTSRDEIFDPCRWDIVENRWKVNRSIVDRRVLIVDR